jgi:hypothetical protein
VVDLKERRILRTLRLPEGTNPDPVFESQVTKLTRL